MKVIQSRMNPFPALKALVICGAGGALFSTVRAPLPWMLGPLLAMAFGKFLGADLASPKGGRATGQLIIGCALGLYFTPVVGHEVVGAEALAQDSHLRGSGLTAWCSRSRCAS